MTTVVGAILNRVKQLPFERKYTMKMIKHIERSITGDILFR